MIFTPTMIKYIIVAVAISIIGYFIYNKVYNIGYLAAEQKYTKIIETYNEKQNSKITEVQNTVASLVQATSTYNTLLSKDMDKIRSSLNGKTLVIYKDGNCTLSTEFLEGRMEAIKRANQK